LLLAELAGALDARVLDGIALSLAQLNAIARHGVHGIELRLALESGALNALVLDAITIGLVQLADLMGAT